MAEDTQNVEDVMEEVSRYIEAAMRTPLPKDVERKTKAHVLDTLSAVISGSTLLAGQLAIAHVRKRGGGGEASVLSSSFRVSCRDAAFANAMMAHADETDDSHKESRSHIGCSVTPAALAMAESLGLSGLALLRSVALGYDIGARALLALGPLPFHQAGHCTHSFAGLFGSCSASASLAQLDRQHIRWVLSYAAQQAAGITSWRRSVDHTEKAFVFGGMPARNAITAVEMVSDGFIGVDDVFTGAHNFFLTFGKTAKPRLLADELGSRFEVMRTTIKKWSVGSPIQSVLDGIAALTAQATFEIQDIEALELRMAPLEIDTVNNREMPDISLQHLAAIALIDRGLTFASSHDDTRVTDLDVQRLRQRIKIIPDTTMERRKAHSCLRMTNGLSYSHQAGAVRGSPENPMTEEEVTAKALDLMSPVLGDDRAKRLAQAIWTLEHVPRVSDLRGLYAAATSD